MWALTSAYSGTKKQMRQFKSAGQAQRDLSCLGVVNNLFRFGHHLMQAKHDRAYRNRSFSHGCRLVASKM